MADVLRLSQSQSRAGYEHAEAAAAGADKVAQPLGIGQEAYAWPQAGDGGGIQAAGATDYLR